MASSPGQQPAGPSVPPVAQAGGVPTPLPDDPVIAVLLVFFIGSAILHMSLFQLNLRRAHKFVFSVLLFGFSMARITALAVRLAWSHHPGNPRIAIAASVLTAAGVLILFVVNLLFALRVVRAYHPAFGWGRGLHWAFSALVASVIGVLVMVIVAGVHLVFTADVAARGRDRQVQLFAAVYLAMAAFLPIPVVLAAWATAGAKVREKFGKGSFRAKMGLLLGTSVLLTLGAAFRAGTAFLAPRPVGNPGWWHSKVAFYLFNFGIEVVVTWAYGLARFDKRFHVPDGCKGPGDYAGKKDEEDGMKMGGVRVNAEEDVFGASEKEAVDETSGGEETMVGEGDEEKDMFGTGETPPPKKEMILVQEKTVEDKTVKETTITPQETAADAKTIDEDEEPETAAPVVVEEETKEVNIDPRRRRRSEHMGAVVEKSKDEGNRRRGSF
ncbi:hypothetical protein B0T18DRAFT_361860 [Schizothecium vesticola]|uniref:Uncharacterized protein n=1 Tax=Schizothecium vesticola TaxID=314040 RepID=A0AA40K9W1_9PEZI|nr:hypothetical protein B0T18DRAFT_361860 [Schizothecium vesticola]